MQLTKIAFEFPAILTFLVFAMPSIAEQLVIKSADQIQIQNFERGHSGYWLNQEFRSRKITILNNDSYRVKQITPGWDESMAAASICEAGDRVLKVKCQSQDFDVEISNIQEKLLDGQITQGAFCSGLVTEQARKKRHAGQVSSPKDPFYGPIEVTITCSK